jgi:hypothetical protein
MMIVKGIMLRSIKLLFIIGIQISRVNIENRHSLIVGFRVIDSSDIIDRSWGT